MHGLHGLMSAAATNGPSPGASPGTRVGYTALRLMGVDVPSWGNQSNNTSKEIGEILV